MLRTRSYTLAQTSTFCTQRKSNPHRVSVEAFLRDLFDLNVEVGHSVRDIKTCVRECRLISPSLPLPFERRFCAAMKPSLLRGESPCSFKIWPVRIFLSPSVTNSRSPSSLRSCRLSQSQHKDLPEVHNRYSNHTVGMQSTLWSTSIDQRVTLGVLSNTEARWLKTDVVFCGGVMPPLCRPKEDQLHFARQRDFPRLASWIPKASQRQNHAVTLSPLCPFW